MGQSRRNVAHRPDSFLMLSRQAISPLIPRPQLREQSLARSIQASTLVLSPRSRQCLKKCWDCLKKRQDPHRPSLNLAPAPVPEVLLALGIAERLASKPMMKKESPEPTAAPIIPPINPVARASEIKLNIIGTRVCPERLQYPNFFCPLNDRCELGCHDGNERHEDRDTSNRLQKSPRGLGYGCNR